MEKILLDTDIGTDIDDAITMSYLLKQKRCELLGITVTGGEDVYKRQDFDCVVEHDAEQTNPAPSISAKVIVRLSPEYLKAMVIR